MRVVAASAELTAAVAALPRPLALLPTMGALHGGHASLCDAACEHARSLVVSVFVNPLQFGDAADLSAYPATPAQDEALCREWGADLLWRPARRDVLASEIPEPVPARLAEDLEGRDRPGHFVGVATVVRELWDAVRPDLAVFGEKDFQQLLVVRDLSARRGGPRVLAAPTVRDPDGLAASSRNVRLSPTARRVAAALPRALAAARSRFADGETDTARLADWVRRALDAAATDDVPVTVHYAQVRDDAWSVVRIGGPSSRMLVAATIGGVRLIDNVLLA